MHYMTKKYWSEEPFHSSHTWTPPKYNSTKIWSIDYFFVHFFGRWNNIIYNQWLFIAIATDPRIFWSAAGLLIWEIFLWAGEFGGGGGPVCCGRGGGMWDKLWFSCEIAQCGKTLISIFQRFSACVGEFLVWGGGLALGYNSMKFRDFCDLS